MPPQPIIEQPVRGYIPGIGFSALAGMERIRALQEGRIPASPVQVLTGLRFVQIGHGAAVASMPASPWFQTQAGYFVSGVSALVADFALGGAISTVLPPWSYPVTSDLNFTFLRPVRPDAGKLIARARLVDSGRNQGTAEALIEDGEGRVIAHATTRCFIRSIEPQDAPSDAPAEVDDAPVPYEQPIPDDLLGPDSLADLSGLDILRRLSTGALRAPFMMLTGLFMNFEVQPGLVSSPFPATPWFQSPAGTIYGGLLCWVADLLTNAAATSTLEPRTGTSGLDLKVHFLRPAMAADGEMLHASGEVVHGGKGLIVCTSKIRSSEGKPLVMATGSFMRRSIRDWVPVVASQRS